MQIALLHVCESDRCLSTAMFDSRPERLERAAAELRLVRAELVDAGRDVAVDARRLRAIRIA